MGKCWRIIEESKECSEYGYARVWNANATATRIVENKETKKRVFGRECVRVRIWIGGCDYCVQVVQATTTTKKKPRKEDRFA